MSLKDIQKDVDDWTAQFTPQYWEPLAMMTRLAEETGEVAREMNHLHGPKKKKASEETKELHQELVDVIFTIVCIANSKGINLQEEWDRAMREKMYGRDANRFEKREQTSE